MEIAVSKIEIAVTLLGHRTLSDLTQHNEMTRLFSKVNMILDI